MTEGAERPLAAVTVPMDSGGGMSPSMGVAAPIGAVSRKDRERAGRTSLRREGPSTLLLLTALPGQVSLEHRAEDGSWQTLSRRPASRLGRTRIGLSPDRASTPQTFRVVFSPRNPNLTVWISAVVTG